MQPQTGKMKNLIIVTVLSLSINSYAADFEPVCRSLMKGNLAEAEWGADLRNEMILKCKGKADSGCIDSYMNKFESRRQKDIAEVAEIFQKNNYDEEKKKFLRLIVMQQQVARSKAFVNGESPKKITNDIYWGCINSQ